VSYLVFVFVVFDGEKEKNSHICIVLTQQDAFIKDHNGKVEFLRLSASFKRDGWL
jgi:hypothetical protein